MFTLFKPISNILGTCKLNCIVTAHLFKFCYQQILHKICHIVKKAEHEVIILYEFGGKGGRKNRIGTQKQPFIAKILRTAFI